MKKLFPIILALIGLGAGVGAGIMFKPDPVETGDEIADNPCGDPEHSDDKTAAKPAETKIEDEVDSENEYVKLNNQFVVPVVKGESVSALVVMSVSVEVSLGNKEVVFKREPKIRDALLSVMFDHAALGGFDGAFTSSVKLDTLRAAMNREVQLILGDEIAKSILITDLVRQDA